ncbi:MAG: hypothetical protein EOL89_13885 [Actinobacteria bacterium]|nr:hypothetical protein [Actinomycetota bacterium]
MLQDPTPPCLSLYQPTHRRLTESDQDPIRFRNLVKELENGLVDRLPKGEVQSLLEPFHDLAADHDFWNHNQDGMAVLATQDLFRVYRLPYTVPERAVVADSFHVKPLLRTLEATDRFQVLAVTREDVHLYEGSGSTMDEVPLHPDVPRTITDALGDQLTERFTNFHAGGGGTAIHHGHGGKAAEVDVDAERFFRAVDRAVTEHHSKPSGLPLILAALPEHHHLFREVSHNPNLLEAALPVHPDALGSLDELRERALELFEPHRRARLAALSERFGSARANGSGDDDPAAIGRAAVSGRVDTLLLEEGREMPGRVDATTGRIDRHGADDVLDDLGQIVRSMGGTVLLVPADSMPAASGAAAIYRY